MNRATTSKTLRRRFPLKSAVVTIIILLLVWHIRTTTFVKKFTTSPVKDPQLLDLVLSRVIRAQNAYQNLLERQSKTLHEARREYKRRYERNPPEGFDKWYHYAIQHGSLIIDDFDTIDETLKPFRSYYRRGCGTRLKERKPQKLLEKNRLLQVCIENGNFTMIVGDQGDPNVQNSLRKLSLDFISEIPDLCFQLNMVDEPRSTIPHNTLQQEESEETFCPTVSFVSYTNQNWWSDATLSCPPQSPSRKFPGRPEPPRGNDLLDDCQSSIDLCSKTTPFEHGILTSPSTLLQSHALVPVVSPASLSTSSDILIPALYRYYEYDQYNASEDISWGKKANKAFWRGGTTGGQNSLFTWNYMHRHRFVSFFKKEDNGLHDLADVKFSRLVQCEKDHVCEELKAHYDIVKESAFSEVWKNKIAFDLDGNGLSGRYYSLLRSNSAVFKQTILREWHDSRTFAWAHYIPFSLEMNELPTLLKLFLEHDEGDKILKKIAENGQEMATSVLRKEDMAVYWYRLWIEMGRKD